MSPGRHPAGKAAKTLNTQLQTLAAALPANITLVAVPRRPSLAEVFSHGVHVANVSGDISGYDIFADNAPPNARRNSSRDARVIAKRLARL